MGAFGKGTMAFFRQHGFDVDYLSYDNGRLVAIDDEGFVFFSVNYIRALNPLADIKAFFQILKIFRERCPDVMLVSLKKLDEHIIDGLHKIRADCPGIGIVLMLTFCNAQDAELLRQLTVKGQGGMALFMKHSLDQVEQLCSAILAVREGQIILDPSLANLMLVGKPECPFLKQLTAREMEILKLLSQGYTNSAIAQTLYIDSKTVEHHLNNIYSKLKADPTFTEGHLRVSAARLYLETMGELSQWEESFAITMARP